MQKITDPTIGHEVRAYKSGIAIPVSKLTGKEEIEIGSQQWHCRIKYFKS